jgi:hypothetical protein
MVYRYVDGTISSKDFPGAERGIATYKAAISIGESDLKKSQEGYEYMISENQSIV